MKQSWIITSRQWMAFVLFALIGHACQSPSTRKVIIDLNHNSDTLELFAPGVVSTSLYERDIAISLAGDEIIYTLGTYDQSRRSLVSIKKTEAVWGEKRIVSFSGVYQDIEPFFTEDGNTLFFASDRPLPEDSTRNDYNVWKSERSNGIWNQPIPLSSLINTPEGEYYPSVSRNGNLYFTATREDGIGREDIFVSKYVNGEYQAPEVLDSNINTRMYEFNAFVSPDEQLLIFSSYGRPDDLGGGDLYVSHRNADGSWLKATNLGPEINSDKLDYCPFVDYQNGNLYFTSDRASTYTPKIDSTDQLMRLANGILNGMGNIYRIKLKTALHD